MNRSDGGVDSSFSVEPKEMSILVKKVKDTHSAISLSDNMRSKFEDKNKIFRRSLYFVEDVEVGETITNKNIRRIRPGFGLSPLFFEQAIGSKCLITAKRGDRVTLEHFSNRKKK